MGKTNLRKIDFESKCGYKDGESLDALDGQLPVQKWQADYLTYKMLKKDLKPIEHREGRSKARASEPVSDGFRQEAYGLPTSPVCRIRLGLSWLLLATPWRDRELPDDHEGTRSLR